MLLDSPDRFSEYVFGYFFHTESLSVILTAGCPPPFKYTASVILNNAYDYDPEYISILVDAFPACEYIYIYLGWIMYLNDRDHLVILVSRNVV